METKTEAYHIYFDPAINAVVMDWDGYATSRQFRQGTEVMLSLLIQHNTYKVLADTSDMMLIAGEDQQWLNEAFLPRAIRSGFKAIAIIKPNAYFNKVALETVSYKVDKEKLTINFFNNTEEAKAWLSSV
jgi:ferredoxin-NADP reductase